MGGERQRLFGEPRLTSQSCPLGSSELSVFPDTEALKGSSQAERQRPYLIPAGVEATGRGGREECRRGQAKGGGKQEQGAGTGGRTQDYFFLKKKKN